MERKGVYLQHRISQLQDFAKHGCDDCSALHVELTIWAEEHEFDPPSKILRGNDCKLSFRVSFGFKDELELRMFPLPGKAFQPLLQGRF